MEIAKNILQQLGGNKFVAMTGARNMVAIDNGLRFKLPSNFANNGINLVEIKLNDLDLYEVKYMKMRGNEIDKDY